MIFSIIKQHFSFLYIFNTKNSFINSKKTILIIKFHKLFFTLLLSVLFIGFSSCSDDDEDTDKGILGTWKYTKVEADAAATSDLEDIIELLESEDLFPIITFYEGNTYKVTYPEYEETEVGTYSLENNILTLYWNGDLDDWDAYKITVAGNTLKIEDDNTEDYQEYDFPDSGVTKAISIHHYTRQ